MSPSDKEKYTSIYNANADTHGDINFACLDPLYASLDVPDTDIRSAWNLVNPSAGESIGKDAALAFFHILNNRHEGVRIPRAVPPSLRASFERNNIDYQLDRSGSPAQRTGFSGAADTSTGRKARFGDTYLSRLGLGGKGAYTPSGTDFSTTATTPDWEEVRLKKQLADLESKMAKIEKAAEERKKRQGGRRGESKPVLVRRELEMMLEFKTRELRELQAGEGKVKERSNLRAIEAEIGLVKEQIEGLAAHLKSREEVLEGLKMEIEAAKR